MIDGKARRSVTAVHNARPCREFPDGLALAETMAAIRRGAQDADAGRLIPLEAAVLRLRAKHGL